MRWIRILTKPCIHSLISQDSDTEHVSAPIADDVVHYRNITTSDSYTQNDQPEDMKEVDHSDEKASRFKDPTQNDMHMMEEMLKKQ